MKNTQSDALVSSEPLAISPTRDLSVTASDAEALQS
jgi:hypothetical protein